MFLKVWITRFWIWLAVLVLVTGVAFWGWLRPSQVRVEAKTVRETVVVEKQVEVTKVVEKIVTATLAARSEPTPTRMSTPSATAIATATVSNSPTSALSASSSVSSTVNVTSTNFVSGTVSSGLVHPVFFEGQSTGKEYRASYDVGVKPAQVGIAFGYAIQWQGRSLGFPTDECGLVVLLPGWYEKFTLTDGRYEVYDLPVGNQDFWIKDLARQRAEEQTNHYGCSMKNPVPVWDSDKPAVVWFFAQVPTVTPTATIKSSPTAAPVKSGTPAPTATTTTAQQVRVRIASGKSGKANFVKGDEVWGFKIVLDSGKSCEGKCYLISAPSAGTVEDGVVNPWPGEVPSSVSAEPWIPQ